jgi:plasmid maintenance system antidote protein VapI
MFDLALNGDEAAAVLGVSRQSLSKLVSQREVIERSAYSWYAAPDATRKMRFYSLEDCQRNYAEYESAISEQSTGPGRKREHVEKRVEVLEMLATCSPQIHYSDAISVSETAELLGYHPSYIPRLIDRSEISARKPWNPRSQAAPRSYIVSRVSCEKYERSRSYNQLQDQSSGASDWINDRCVDEGRKMPRTINETERNRRIVELKKTTILQTTGTLRCEVCDFDFAAAYGPRGLGFAECHHRVPFRRTPGKPRKTSIKDLAIVCANCHRMLEIEPAVSVEDLRGLIRQRALNRLSPGAKATL